MITNIELTEAGTERLNAWLQDIGGPALNLQQVSFEVMDIIAGRMAGGESLVYELGQQFTSTGRPETIEFSADEVIVERQPDDE